MSRRKNIIIVIVALLAMGCSYSLLAFGEYIGFALTGMVYIYILLLTQLQDSAELSKPKVYCKKARMEFFLDTTVMLQITVVVALVLDNISSDYRMALVVVVIIQAVVYYLLYMAIVWINNSNRAKLDTARQNMVDR